jgi:Spy/CpxP family protein refolding chaperone
MKKIAILTLLFTLACTTTLLSAQVQSTHTPPDPATIAQHRVAFLTTLLSLNSTQQQQATTIFTAAATSGLSIRSQIKTARQSLATAVKSNDSAGINQQSSTIGGLVSQLTSTMATAKAAFYQILTPDQQNKLSQLESQRHGMGFKGMRGEF